MASNLDPGYAAVLVDVIGSRRHGSRAGLQAALEEAAAEVGRRAAAWGPVEIDGFAITVGDELQATYTGVRPALRAAADLRLRLLVHEIDVRVGIGWGEIVVRDPGRSPLGQDGSAWWSARAALDRVATATAWSDYPRRTAVLVATEPSTGDVGAGLPPPSPLDVEPGSMLAGHLALLDRSLALLDAEDALVVLNDLDDADTAQVAARLEVGESAVSMRRTRNHLRELTFALRALVEDVAT